ncbi:MAG: hypothetical protein WBY53_19985 [Acidobacteriaceae bacterium]
MTGLQLFTLIHVLISLIGIGAGIVILVGFLNGVAKRFWNPVFLTTTALTSVTGFFFPFHGITPGIAIGIVSILILVPAFISCWKRWVRTYIVSATALELLNVIVLIAQLFQKVKPLHQYAPKGNEPIVAMVQLAALLVFVAVGWTAVRRSQSTLRR